MKKLVTHINPHLDDIVAMWLFVRLVPDFKDAELLFKAKGEIETLSGEKADSDPDVIYLGTGMGKFDEHKGDLNDCAATLVWKYIQAEGFAPKDKYIEGAYEHVVDYTFLEDTAKLDKYDFNSFMISSLVRSHLELTNDSLKTTLFFFEVLDTELITQKKTVLGEEAWETRIDFETTWGKGAGMKMHGRSSGKDIAFRNGRVLIIFEDLEKGYKGFSADATSNVDLTEAYEKVKGLEPEADWYLHHSKKLLLCGSDVAENKNLSKLSLQELIDILRI